ncbi:MAG: Kdo hydroxylase family protein [Acidobacteriota bacterium]|nr:Kdo hydroxylase family protein [Blastocatellia bacterium]MDW8240050.1 Kdo hydroxylase family protein [Acidobacteriota bacterium]
MGRIIVAETTGLNRIGGVTNALEAALWRCRQLEEGHILYFPQTPFELTPEERQFLLGQQQTGAGYHKNIAYRPLQHRVTGVASRARAQIEQLKTVMQAYSCRVTEFLSQFLAPYASSWRLDYASFRPQEEQGRNLRRRLRNDLLHVDAFPTRPTYGDRILRVFTNINPTEPRRWLTAETADVLIRRFVGASELPSPRPSDRSTWRTRWRSLLKRGQALGLPLALRSPYDEFMLRLHHFMKENHAYQLSCTKDAWEFPPNSTWIVFTDMLAHAVLSGQYALEQTYIVSRHAMVAPEKAPIHVLETLVGAPLGEP